jgi:hypothetical protein
MVDMYRHPFTIGVQRVKMTRDSNTILRHFEDIVLYLPRLGDGLGHLSRFSDA